MKNLILTFTVVLFTLNSVTSQINPLDIIDKIGSALLPKVVDGVKDIQEAKRKNKNEEAEKLKTDFETELKEATKTAKMAAITEVGKDIEYLNTISIIQQKIERISNDVGRISLFKDVNFIDNLLKQQSVVVKNEIVRKFQNALEQVNENKSTLNSLRDNIKTESVPASGQAASYINAIISKLEEINSSTNDCPQLKEDNKDEDKINSCLRTIKSVSNDIATLENQVESLNSSTSQMLITYLTQYRKIKGE